MEAIPETGAKTLQVQCLRPGIRSAVESADRAISCEPTLARHVSFDRRRDEETLDWLPSEIGIANPGDPPGDLISRGDRARVAARIIPKHPQIPSLETFPFGCSQKPIPVMPPPQSMIQRQAVWSWPNASPAS